MIDKITYNDGAMIINNFFKKEVEELSFDEKIKAEEKFLEEEKKYRIIALKEESPMLMFGSLVFFIATLIISVAYNLILLPIPLIYLILSIYYFNKNLKSCFRNSILLSDEGTKGRKWHFMEDEKRRLFAEKTLKGCEVIHHTETRTFVMITPNNDYYTYSEQDLINIEQQKLF